MAVTWPYAYFLSAANYVVAVRGVATGGISVFMPPKSAQVNFLWGKNDVRTAIRQFYTPQKQISGYAPGCNILSQRQ